MAPAQRKNAKKAGREVAEKPKKLTPEELKAQEEREDRLRRLRGAAGAPALRLRAPGARPEGARRRAGARAPAPGPGPQGRPMDAAVPGGGRAGVAHLATSADLTRVSGARFSLAAGALSPGAGCQAPSPDLCGRAPPLPDGFKADAARVGFGTSGA